MRSAGIGACRSTAVTRAGARSASTSRTTRAATRPGRRPRPCVSIEGGPGYSTTADRPAGSPCRGRSRRGATCSWSTSAAPAARARSTARRSPPHPPLLELAGRCARQLGFERNFYDTSQSVQDIEAVLGSLHAGKVDLYGDSYGSYAAQAFALRYPVAAALAGRWTAPTRCRAPIPSSATCWRGRGCATPGLRPPAAVHGARRPGRRAGRPRAPCAPASDRRLDARRQRRPVFTHGERGHARPDGAARLRVAGRVPRPAGRDPLPRSGGHPAAAAPGRRDGTMDGGGERPVRFSEALYLVGGLPRLSPAVAVQRADVGRLAIAQPGSTMPASPSTRSGGFAWIGHRLRGRAWQCLQVAVARLPRPAGAAATPYPHVPTLVLSGDLDNITPLEDARVVAGRFPDSHLVVSRTSCTWRRSRTTSTVPSTSMRTSWPISTRATPRAPGGRLRCASSIPSRST